MASTNMEYKMKNFKYSLFALSAILIISFVATGCGGGGSKSDDSTISAALYPGKLTYENGGEENILFASVKGSGISDGWIENQNGVKTGNNLVYNRPANAYEIMLSSKNTALPAGTWVLKYFVGSEQFEQKKQNLSWTTLPGFLNMPAPTWNSEFKRLSLQLPSVNGGNPAFYLRLYYADSPATMFEESSPQSGGLITMQINFPGDYLIMLVADFKENDQTVSTARHVFSVMTLN